MLLKKYCFNWLCTHWFLSWVMLQVLRLLYNQSFMSLVALILDNRTWNVCIYKIINFIFKIRFLSWSLIGTNNYLPTLKSNIDTLTICKHMLHNCTLLSGLVARIRKNTYQRDLNQVLVDTTQWIIVQYSILGVYNILGF